MSRKKEDSLIQIVKGSGIVFLGVIIGNLLTFLTRVLIGRFFTQAQYGIYSIGLTILSIFTLISILGLDEGTSRQIAFYRGKNKSKKIKDVIYTSIKTVLIVSIFLSLIFFFASNTISIKIFNDYSLSFPLTIIAIAVPFFVLIRIFISIFRGFDQVKPRVYFSNIGKNLIFLLLLIPIVILKLSFIYVICAFSFSFIITFCVLAFYFYKKIPVNICFKELIFGSIEKNLIFFSLPLFASGMLMTVKSWTDTVMLGIFETTSSVGLYNAALPISGLLSIFLLSIGFIFTPIASKLYGNGRIEEIKRNYLAITKWCFILTVPFFIIILFFPGEILRILFGPEYVSASIALQILAIGFFIDPATGPGFHIMIAMGKNKILLKIFLITSITNIILNAILIPIYGIVGAAVATTSALILASTLVLIELLRLSGFHPISKNYIKSVIVSCFVTIIIYPLAKYFMKISFWFLFVIIILFIILLILFLVLTKTFDKEDIDLLLTIEKQAGVNLTLIKKIFKRLISISL